MVYLLDYSANKIDGATIKAAGYAGVVRYIDSPANLTAKHTNLTEYRSHLAAGLAVLLVMQTTTTASDGGYMVGQAHARRALTGANRLGYTGPIFFTNDRTTLPNPAAWRAYLDGAVSILGYHRVGAYGFRNAVDAAIGHATYFWQAGRRSDVAAHTHLWQDNNTQVTVGGTICDRNLVLRDIVQAKEEPHMRDLVLAKVANDPAVWVGDGIKRRKVADQIELGGLQFQIKNRGGDGTVNVWEDLRVLGEIETPAGAIVGAIGVQLDALSAKIDAVGDVELDYDRFVGDVSRQVINAVTSNLGRIEWTPSAPEQTR